MATEYLHGEAGVWLIGMPGGYIDRTSAVANPLKRDLSPKWKPQP